MKKILSYLGAATLLVASIATGSLLGNVLMEKSSYQQPFGSVQRSSEYQSTSTVSGQAAFLYKISSSTAILGSVVISSSTASGVWLYNWDGAGASVTASGTLIAYFPANATAGTYTFDILATRGLYVSTTAANTGNYTVTFR